MIQTVLGTIHPDELGVCLPHEHIWCDQRLAPRADLFDVTRFTDSFMCLNHFDRMVSELKAYREAGGRAIVEVTCDGWGRDVEVLARLSEAAEVHIIATTGFYVEPCMPRYVADWSVARLADHITREIEEGTGPNHRRCGVVKSAIHRARVEGLEAKGLEAVAIAQKRTGVAITTHTTGSRRQEIPGGNAGVEQLELLKSRDVNPTRLIIGHVDERPDLDVLSALAAEGCFIQFDVIGKQHWLLDETRAELIQAFVERGYLEHLLLSQDRNRDDEMRYRGNTGYCHILESFLPRLHQLGVTAEQIQAMMVHNPARALTLA